MPPNGRPAEGTDGGGKYGPGGYPGEEKAGWGCGGPGMKGVCGGITREEPKLCKNSRPCCFDGAPCLLGAKSPSIRATVHTIKCFVFTPWVNLE